ncbi:helix-turn-helix domain-containing protein [Thermoactinospora rubra]|uniref:helix-turn-helix domain-containing protein n=1 Tax=Thermoactinospora rubra TaxID=1088767 RepID=UPI00197F7ADB|nr:AraC family transcriptional regulator [Thermoactinospora rubra]
MRTSVCLSRGAGFAVHSVTCRDDHRGWSSAEAVRGYQVVLVRRGRFRRLADGRADDLDPTLGYVSAPGMEERFAHPAGGDVCTSLQLSPSLWRSLAGEARPGSGLYVDARLELAHRRLLAAAATGDSGYAVAESLLGLVAAALSRATGAAARPSSPSSPRSLSSPRFPSSPASPASRAASVSLVSRAREAIAARHPAADGLVPLAALLGASPYQLSRAFTRELGVSLTHYRNRVRVGWALDRLEDGETSLALLAADLGFADQAHLTRTMRHHLGHTPTALRRLLSRSPA